MNHPAAMATREAIKDIMRFWLSHGCDGFRVDMANSLVKRDDWEHSGASMIWRDVRRMLELEFPDAAMVSEWSDPKHALRAGFDMDFYLNHPGNGYSTLLRDYDNDGDHDASYFKKDSGGNINRFLGQYIDWYEDTKDVGYISLLTCNHDTTRPSFNLDERELKLAYAFIFTMPGVPFLYYGDEIGMRFLDVPTKEGGYTRTGSRTPMQWNRGKNLGFSDGAPEDLYLPVDPSDDAPTVEDQKKDMYSLLNTVKTILKLRRKEVQLQADESFSVVCSEPDKPFIYHRGHLLLAINPKGQECSMDLDMRDRAVIFRIGNGKLHNGKLTMGPQSFVIFR